MHPIEHLYYYACILPSLVFFLSPFAFIWNGVHLLLAPGASHSGASDSTGWQLPCLAPAPPLADAKPCIVVHVRGGSCARCRILLPWHGGGGRGGGCLLACLLVC
jgi:hypothetical protein